MTRRTFGSTFARVALGAGCLLASASCGSEMLRTGRSPVYLVVTSMEAQAGGEGSSAFLLSDVQTVIDDVPTIINDNISATIRSVRKNQTVGADPLNTVTLTRYRVAFIRSDGRNTPGVDVPYGFDGGLSVAIEADATQAVVVELVRHQAKLESPLRNLRNAGGLVFISTIAEITFYGHDQNGNDVSVVGRIDVQFGDFADE